MTEQLLPCPFCGGELYSCDYDGGKTRYAHAATGCILDRKFVQGEKQKADWNRRTPPPSEHVALPDLRALAVEIVDGIRGYTFELSSHPAAHKDDYDFIEQKLLAALTTTEGKDNG